jgi:hypothetical protein
MLETTGLGIPLEEVVRLYKELAEEERGWLPLKSTVFLRPVYQWTEKRIRAHIFICVLAVHKRSGRSPFSKAYWFERVIVNHELKPFGLVCRYW